MFLIYCKIRVVLKFFSELRPAVPLLPAINGTASSTLGLQTETELQENILPMPTALPEQDAMKTEDQSAPTVPSWQYLRKMTDPDCTWGGTYLQNDPTYCAFNCHRHKDLTMTRFDPIVE